MAASRKVTLRQIAEKSGVTRMAVSLALRGKPGVSEVTRRKVLNVARKLGYVPDPDVAKLMAHIRASASTPTRATLALLTSGSSPDNWKRFATERKYVEGTRARAKEYGYGVELFWMNEPGMNPRRLSDILWNRGIEGVIIAPLMERLSSSATRSIILDLDRFSSIEISETFTSPELHRALHDQYTSMVRLLDELVALNYAPIGFVLEESLDLRVNRKWTAAYLQVRDRLGTKRMPPPLILPSVNQAAFDRWFDRYRPGVVISVDRFGLRFLEARGIKIPDEVGYASLDLDGLDERHAGMSGIDQNSRRVGAAAVDMLVSAIQRGQRGIPTQPVRTQVEGLWVPGNSTVLQPGA